MKAKETHGTRRWRKTGIWILTSLLALIVVLILLVVFLVPWFVSSERGRLIILAKINDTIDGELDFAGLSMGWRDGIKIANLRFNDSSKQISVEAEQIVTKPHYVSILSSGLSLGETIIDKPRVEINLKGQPTTKEAREQPRGKEAQAVTLPIKKIDMVVSDGSLKVTGRKGETIVLSQINSRLNLRPPGQQTSFDVDMAVVDEGSKSKLHADGQLTPEKKVGWSLEGISGDLTVEVNDLDIESLGPIFALAGIEIQAKGSLLADVKSRIKDGRLENLDGTVKGKGLDVVLEQLKGDRFKSSNLDVSIKLAREGELINIENLQAETDWLKARAGGYVPTTFGSLAEFIKADSKNNLKASFECDLAQLVSQMPRTIGLKEATEVTSGSLTGNIEKVVEAGQARIVGEINLAGLAGMVDGKKAALSEPVSVTAEITSDKEAVRYDKLDVISSFAKISCAGSSESLGYNANINLAKLQSELGQFIDMGRYQMAGGLFSEGTISGKGDVISADVSSVIKNIRLSSEKGLSAIEPQADLSFALDIDRKSNIVNVASAKCNASFCQISTKDAVLPTGKEAAKALSLPIAARVDLAGIQPFLVLFGVSSLKDVQLGGIAESAVSFSSEKGVYSIVTDSTKIKNFRLVSAGQKPFEQQEVSFTCDAKLKPTDKTFAVKCQLESPQIKLKGNFAQTTKDNKARLDGQADLDYNWSAVSAVASPFLPGGLSLKGQRKDTISLLSEYPADKPEQLMANLSTKAKLGFEEADYMGLKFAPTETEIKIQEGFLTIAPFSTTVNNGKLNFAGNINLKEKPIALRIDKPMQIIDKVNINDVVSKLMLVYLNPIFKDQANISGIASFQADKLNIPLGTSATKSLEIVGTVGIEKIRMESTGLVGQILSLGEVLSRGGIRRYVDATLMPTKFEMRNGILSYEDMQLNVDNFPLNFGGSIGPNRKLQMTVTAPFILNSDFKFRPVRIDDKDVANRLRLPLTGTIDKPELDLGKLLKEQLKSQLRQRLEDELKGQLQERLKGEPKKGSTEDLLKELEGLLKK